MRDETFAVLAVYALDAIDLEHIDADAVDHRAARINVFHVAHGLGRPSNRARAMIEWPMFSSTISAIAAIGSTL